ncbi:MAG: carbohydrate binding family 9 domain-containing protein [Cyclobacteriaceae bacterium]|nr:carbohydrate binding family 9 domain-containing protein [Cyclobacteriaceae bacterium]
MKKKIIFTGLLALISLMALGQEDTKRIYTATKTEVAPLINGNLDDEAWAVGVWSGDFIQHEPFEGQKPTQPTEFKVLYDNNFLYVAIKAYDSSPDSIVNRMTRRDDIDGDFVGISLDCYHDLRTGFTFLVSSTGVKMDIMLSNDGMTEDTSWDPIWYVKTRMQDWGWSTEMKIPFTQLRFEKNSDEVWGFEVLRQNYRNDEMSFWQAIPRNASGLIHLFGELNGLENVEPRKILDLTPYAVGSFEKYEATEGNPYASGKDFIPNVGLDGKIGVTNNLTMDFTINPDFGQVEADPSQVNLTAYEVFFNERRPFFVEGKNITSLRVGIGDGDIGNDNLFYSRRIGKRPSGSARIANGEHAKTPRNVRILGAAKLTGKTKDGLSIGIMESVTPRTFAKINSAGIETDQEVEPLTNYFVGRIQKDFNEGNTMVGGMITHTARALSNVENLESSDLNSLHQSALTGGLDYTRFFKDKNWNLSLSTAFSQVQGSEEAIRATQLSARHLYQRPDAHHMAYDSTRTSLGGYGGKMEFGKFGGNWNFMLFSTLRSPGFEINDLGYLRSADEMIHGIWSAYQITKPKSFYRSIRLNSNLWTSWDYAFTYRGMGGNFGIFTQYKNFWSTNVGILFNGSGTSTSLLRGGPNMKLPGSTGMFYSLNSDNRKLIRVGFFGNHSRGNENYSISNSYSVNLSYQPFNTLKLTLQPAFNNNLSELQYVDMRVNEAGTNSYIFARLNQKVFSTSLRISYSITPDLTIQYWGQPFFAAADYSKFKKVDRPMASKFTDRFHVFNSQEIREADGVYFIDEDLQGTDDYTLDNPDFVFDEFLSNMVLRWEFVPGSTLYMVWSQTRDAFTNTGEFDFNNNVNILFKEEKPYNVFLIKLSYRIGLH